MKKYSVLFILIYFGFFCTYTGATMLSNQKHLNCLLQYMKHQSHSFIMMIPMDSQKRIKEIFPNVLLSNSPINVKNFISELKTKDTTMFKSKIMKTNASLTFTMIDQIYRYTIPKYMIVNFLQTKGTYLKRLKLYINTINNFTSYTRYSTVNHRLKHKIKLHRPFSFIYVFYIPSTQRAWVSLFYQVTLNPKDIPIILYKKNVCL